MSADESAGGREGRAAEGDEIPVEQRVAGHLRRYREVFDAGGLGGVRELPSVFWELQGYDPEDAEGRGDLFEVLGYDALALERPGWAYVCLRAAAEQLDVAGDREALRRVRLAARQVLRTSFAPYESDVACYEDIRRWARERIAEVAALARGDVEEDELQRPGSVVNATTALKHQWTFRLLRTHEIGRRMRFDDLVERFGLAPEDRVLLRVLAALHWDPVFEHAALAAGFDAGPLTVGQLVDLVAESPGSRPGWLDRFDPRHPLLRWGLVHLGGTGALRHRPVQPAEAVLARLDARDAWPVALRDVATVRTVPERALPSFLGPAAERLDRVHERRQRTGARLHVLLASPSSIAARGLVDLWAGERRIPVIELASTALDAAQIRALAAEVALRDAVVFVPREAGPVSGDLARVVVGSLLVDTAPTGSLRGRARIDRVVVVEVEPPDRPTRLALWNEALITHGLAETSPEALDEHLGDYALHPGEIARVVAQAADQAWLEHEGGGPVRADVARLRDVLLDDAELAERIEGE